MSDEAQELIDGYDRDIFKLMKVDIQDELPKTKELLKTVKCHHCLEPIKIYK